MSGDELLLFLQLLQHLGPDFGLALRVQSQSFFELAEPDLPASVLEMLPGKTIQLGVIDVGREEIETPGKVAARLRAALEIVPAQRLIAAPDCGCAALPRAVARAKLNSLVAGARMVRSELDAR